MGLDATVRAAVKIADTLVKSLEETVTHKAWTGQDGYGAATYATTTPKALVEQKLQLRRLADGRMVQVKAKLTFLQVLTPNGASGRMEPVDPRDRFVLADGTTGPIADVDGLRDPGMARPYLLEVWLGV